MRLPRVRLKLWMLAVLVALAGVGFGAERTMRRVRHAREMAELYADLEDDCRRQLAERETRLAETEAYLAEARQDQARSDGYQKVVAGYMVADLVRVAAHDREIRDESRARLDLKVRLRRKWERTTRFPWPSVAPDPPPPE